MFGYGLYVVNKVRLIAFYRVRGASQAHLHMILEKFCMVFNDGIGKHIIILDTI